MVQPTPHPPSGWEVTRTVQFQLRELQPPVLRLDRDVIVSGNAVLSYVSVEKY